MMNVCRVCLAKGVKMYHMSEHNMNVVYKQVTGIEINTEDKLPKMLCWECVARLSSANNFIKKAVKTHLMLMDKMKSRGSISMDDLELIDKTEFRSTLGVKFYKDNYSYIHIMESDNDVKSSEPSYIDIYNVEEQMSVPQDIVNSNIDKIKSEYSDETESDNDVETDISKASVDTEFQNMEIKTETFEISVTENAIDEEMLIDDKSNVRRMIEMGIHVMDDTTYLDDLKKQNWDSKSEALPNSKDLGVVIENVVLTLNKDNIQDAKYITDNAQSSKDNNERFSQGTINDENNCSEMLTFSANTVEVSKYIDTPCETSSISEWRGSVHSNKSAPHNGPMSSSKLGCEQSVQKQPNFAYETSISKHTNNIVFTCEYCTFETSVKTRLRHHTDTNHYKSSFKCAHCSFVTNIRDRLVTHNNSKHVEKMAFNCSYCTYNTFFKSNLMRHMNVKHTKVKVFKCTFCNYEAYYKNTLNKHINAKHTNTKVFNCSHCNYKTCDNRYLTEHINTKHTKSDVFNCSICEYKAYKKRALKDHISYKHDKTNVFSCCFCNYKTCNSNVLKGHINSQHTKTDVFNCSHCDYKAYTKRYLKEHINAKHTKTDVFHCSFCNYETYNTKHLKRHINTKHTRVNVFICDYCNQQVSHKSTLVRHIKIKHP